MVPAAEQPTDAGAGERRGARGQGAAEVRRRERVAVGDDLADAPGWTRPHDT